MFRLRAPSLREVLAAVAAPQVGVGVFSVTNRSSRSLGDEIASLSCSLDGPVTLGPVVVGAVIPLSLGVVSTGHHSPSHAVRCTRAAQTRYKGVIGISYRPMWFRIVRLSVCQRNPSPPIGAARRT